MDGSLRGCSEGDGRRRRHKSRVKGRQIEGTRRGTEERQMVREVS